MDSLRLKIAFLCSCLIHTILILGVKIIPKSRPIVISFPVELISLETPEKKIEEKIVIPPQKKEEIVLPKKTKKSCKKRNYKKRS